MKYFFFFLIFFSASIYPDTCKVIHVFVALCDNEHQGIVPVPKKLGNGEDLINNLYWGAAYGVKSYFKKNNDWKLVYDSVIHDNEILERCVFKKESTYLCADAFRGIKIKAAINSFIKSVAGELNDSVKVQGKTIGICGNSDLLAYVGHNGLMDFRLDYVFQQRIDAKGKDVIVLCCMSKQYFYNIIKSAGSNPLLLTTNLIAPEAYARVPLTREQLIMINCVPWLSGTVS